MARWEERWFDDDGVGFWISGGRIMATHIGGGMDTPYVGGTASFDEFVENYKPDVSGYDSHPAKVLDWTLDPTWGGLYEV